MAPVKARPSEQDLEALASDLTALANPTRLKIIHLLTSPRYGEELSRDLDTSRQAALKHVQRLEDRGFVRPLNGWRSTGPVIEYEVVPQRLFALGVTLNDLAKLQPEGGPQVKRQDRTMVVTPSTDAGPEPAREARHAHLLILTGPHAGERFPLAGDAKRWTIGRAEDRDLIVSHDPFVSSCHAEVQRSGEASFDLVDVMSANGTRVNFARLPKGDRVELEPGDVIGVGHTLFAFQWR